MSCAGRYAEVADFAAFWCQAIVIRGKHTSGVDVVSLVDATRDFLDAGVEVGQFVRNDTDGSIGKITNVTTTSIVAALRDGVENLWDVGDSYALVLMDYEKAVTIQEFLDISAAEIGVAMQTSGQCDCSLTAASIAYLKKINIITAAVVHSCPCGGDTIWSDEVKETWLNWVNAQVERIASGQMELCEGQTGRDYPYFTNVEQSRTPENAAEIAYKQIVRDGF